VPHGGQTAPRRVRGVGTTGGAAVLLEVPRLLALTCDGHATISAFLDPFAPMALRVEPVGGVWSLTWRSPRSPRRRTRPHTRSPTSSWRPHARAGLMHDAVAQRMGTTQSVVPRLESAGRRAPVRRHGGRPHDKGP